ncbi:uncharacterized protein LOC123525957 [Mercenaria mercenaria]|uniref:uncharacterized protein LOC123525957 n=1 Tax=Mercenaria mercenaria TaxID=6596 RepID=UPI00234EBA14|nr:uncharacterized protein LOC123525957 [Mercenaria mercenaria]
MGYPLNDAGEFQLDVDASGLGIGGVLSQMQEGRECVIAYASRGLNKAEQNYCVTEKELLAVVYFVQYFRQYLLGRRFKIHTDHQALVWLFRLKEPSEKVARWIEILADFDFQIEYRPGKKQGHCDALSRCMTPHDCTYSEVDMSEPLKCGPCRKCKRRAETMMMDGPQTLYNSQVNGNDADVDASATSKETTDPVKAVTAQGSEQPSTSRRPTTENNAKTGGCWIGGYTAGEICTMQRNDPNLGLILPALVNGIRPSVSDMFDKSAEARHYWILWGVLFIKEGMLCKHFKKADNTGEANQILVPRILRENVMRQSHTVLTAGHLGAKKTKARILQGFYWYGMTEDVKLFIQRCDVCECDKGLQKTPKAPLTNIVTGAPWDILAIDFTGPFPVTPRGNRYIMVLADHFTKYVEVVPVPNQTAEECAARVLNDFVARWGTPLAIHTDQGAAFESKLFKELCSMLEVRKTRASARHPQGNGQVERMMKTLLKMVRAYLVGEQDEWDVNLGCLAGAYRATPHESTKLTPNLLAMGHEVRLPADLIFGHKDIRTEERPTCGEYVQDMREHLHKAHEVARRHLKMSAKRSKQIYDVKRVYTYMRLEM